MLLRLLYLAGQKVPLFDINKKGLYHLYDILKIVKAVIFYLFSDENTARFNADIFIMHVPLLAVDNGLLFAR